MKEAAHYALSSCFYSNLYMHYCDKPRLPPDLCMLCLEYAGLCRKGRKSSFFWVLF